MSAFKPDVESLLQRFKIDKPNETFEFGPVAPDPTEIPTAQNKTDFLVPQQPLLVRLEDEASKVQDIIDIINDTASQISVPVPQEHVPFIGTTVTTKDYLGSLETTSEQDPNRLQKQQHFEWGVLTSAGDTAHWPTLLAPDLIDIRNSLLSARDTVAGTILSGTPNSSGGNNWSTSVMNSDLTQVHESLIQTSQKYRFKAAQTVFTYGSSLDSQFLNSTLVPALQREASQIRPVLIEIISFLTNLRNILAAQTQLLLAFEFVRAREALLNVLESSIISNLTNILVVKLSNIVSSIANPILNTLQTGIKHSGSLIDKATDEVSRQLISIVGGTIQAMVLQYKMTAADLIRENNNKSNIQLSKLQSLGERSTVGRWITHLDQIITTLQKAVSNPNLSLQVVSRSVVDATNAPITPNFSIIQRFLDHPQLSQAANIPFPVRTVGIAPTEPPPIIPFFNEGPQSPTQQPIYGSSDVNPTTG